MKHLALAALVVFPGLAAAAATMPWTVTRTWSQAEEKKFSEFVATLGNSGCNNLTQCLASPKSNPSYAAKTPAGVTFPADCADLPFALRMYFAWAEELPFDYVDRVAPAQPDQETNPDIRYTKFGNKPAGRHIIQAGATYDYMVEYTRMRDSVSTATYRMHYDMISDFYPPALDLKNIRPGTVVYDPSGHAAIIYKIESDGRLRMIDAHPDNSITHITFDKKFVRSRPAHGAGFKNWRPELNQDPSAKLAGFSTEEFQQSYTLDGQPADYYDYVRAKMAGGSLRFEPVVEIRNMTAEVCSNVHDREAAVATALGAGIQNKAHPDRLPINIYGTSGEWEEYSSPSRDARLKVAFAELLNQMQRYVEMFRKGDARVVYQPVASKYSATCANDKNCFLVASLMSAYEELVNGEGCEFSYTDSVGAKRKLCFQDVHERLFALSFDPYNCAELRWGEQGKGLATCGDDRLKQQWYAAEQGLRNQIERTYDARMDADLAGAAKLGVAQAPDIDLWSYLSGLLKPGS